MILWEQNHQNASNKNAETSNNTGVNYERN